MKKAALTSEPLDAGFRRQREGSLAGQWTIWKYDFSYLCFVGRPDPSMTYLRR